jgi:TIR domain
MSEAQMKVFISWSGDYSRQLAAAIDWWLPKVLNQVEVYFSDIDIEVGSRWYHSIVDNLEKSDAGLVIWWPKLNQRVATITKAPQPVLQEPDQKDLLQGAATTR